jgi:uncharacterized protein YktB (UPF0637 family)
MTTRAGASIMPLETVTAGFDGFTPEDFEVFEVPGFAARMPLLRAQVKPKLTALGGTLAPLLSETLGETLYPHVAQHLRRTVNAPEETWVAFARSPRAYKPFVHLRVAIRADKVRIVVFLEDDAEDKSRFAANLNRNAEPLSDYLGHHPPIRACDIPDAEGKPKYGRALDACTLRAFAARLDRVKGQHAAFGIAFDKSHRVLASGPEFVEAALEAAVKLKPLYACGAITDFDYNYVPEFIEHPLLP